MMSKQVKMKEISLDEGERKDLNNAIRVLNKINRFIGGSDTLYIDGCDSFNKQGFQILISDLDNITFGELFIKECEEDD